MELFEDDTPGRNEPEFSVTELSGAIKRVVEGEFGRVRVRGELGRVMTYRSGHTYLDLKDEKAVISGVVWKGQFGKLSVKPEEGMEVIATGRITTFPGQSKYQIVIDDIRVAGVGALMAMLEKRKKMLEAEGLFAAERKKQIPFLPEVIGVVTSPQGAVIRDILHRLRERFPRRVLIWPVAVQGEACAPQVTAAIEGFNAIEPGGPIPKPDLLIVARGGGSIEDLWGFNEESVARAAAASEIPLISAVGHETDTTLIDFVSDLRAPTPTAAAELAVPVRLELLAGVDSLSSRMQRAVSQKGRTSRQRLSDLARALPRPETLTQNAAQRLDNVAMRLPRALQSIAQNRRGQLTEAASALRPSVLRQGLAQRKEQMTNLENRGKRALESKRSFAAERLGRLVPRFSKDKFTRNKTRLRDRLIELDERLTMRARSAISSERERLDRLDRLRETLSYEATLDRGFAVIWDGEKVVTDKARANTAKSLEIEFKDGRYKVEKNTKKSSAKPKDDPDQTSLF